MRNKIKRLLGYILIVISIIVIIVLISLAQIYIEYSNENKHIDIPDSSLFSTIYESENSTLVNIVAEYKVYKDNNTEALWLKVEDSNILKMKTNTDESVYNIPELKLIMYKECILLKDIENEVTYIYMSNESNLGYY